MPLPNTIQGVDPFTKERIDFKDYKQVVRKCYQIIKRCVEENEKRGKKGDARFIVCAIHTNTPEHRHCWLNLTCHEPEHGIECSAPKNAYAGALSHAENLISGEWRYASAEEEIQCKQRDDDASAAKMKSRGQQVAANAAVTLNELAKAVMGNQPAPVQEPVKQTPPPSAGVKTKELEKK